MTKKAKSKKRVPAKSTGRDLTVAKENLEKAGRAIGDIFQGLFNGLGKILSVAQDMEKKGEKERTYKKEIKGITESGKEFRGEAGWRIKTGIGLLGGGPKRKRRK